MKLVESVLFYYAGLILNKQLSFKASFMTFSKMVSDTFIQKAFLALVFISCCSHSALAQKGKTYFYELDVNRGLLYKPNTIAPFTGTAIDVFPKGKKKMTVPIKEGKIHGTVKEWAQNGKKIYEASYENGLQTNMERQWYANGNKKLELQYVAGKPNGVCTEWFKNEKKKSEGQFVDGKEEGKHQWWYDNGNLDQIVFYKSGLTEGTVRSWHRNGQDRMTSEYTNGKQNGPSKEWYINGQLKHQSNFKNGLEDGEFYHWSSKGKLLGLKKYENGVLKEDYNYRSGNIRKENGYVQIFNEKESFFQIDIEGEEVLPLRGPDIAYAVDGMMLQLFNISVASAEAQADNNKSSLEKYLQFESDYIRKMTSYDIQVEKEFGKTENGIDYLMWQFVSPSSEDKEQKARTVQREYYLSFVCNNRILNLYSVQTNSDQPAAISAMLKSAANTLVIEKERIDLNGVVRNIQQQNR